MVIGSLVPVGVMPMETPPSPVCTFTAVPVGPTLTVPPDGPTVTDVVPLLPVEAPPNGGGCDVLVLPLPPVADVLVLRLGVLVVSAFRVCVFVRVCGLDDVLSAVAALLFGVVTLR
jgi:hypothetical protein